MDKGNDSVIDYNYLHSFFQFKGRKPFELKERTISSEEFKKFADAAPRTDSNFNIFIENTADYNEFVVYNDIGFLSGRAGIKTPDEKFNITIIRS